MKKSVKHSKQEKKARRLAGFLTWLMIFSIISGLLGCYLVLLKPEKQYMDASKLLEEKSYAEAGRLFSTIEDYRDSKNKAQTASCLSLFERGEVEAASNLYLNSLDADTQAQVRESIGSFEELGNKAVEAGSYADAFYYYKLMPDGGREDTMYALDVYTEAENDILYGDYSDAREKAASALDKSEEMAAPLQKLIDESYEKEFSHYLQLGESDLNAAAEGMELMQDEYEEAGRYLRDLEDAYRGGVQYQDEGKYKQAIEFFENIITYKDCRLKISECQVMLYEEQAKAGQTQDALSGVMSLYDWENAIYVLPEDSVLLPLLLPEDENESIPESTEDEVA
ncbi:MAG: hypothetical protein K5784_08645 [Clostridiales bacterium]|nr:hypothetical protein [Clostridiales bacterium]